MIRNAQISDAPFIAAIQVDTWRLAYKGIIPDSFLAKLSVELKTSSWIHQIADEQTQVIVAESDGVITGFLSGGNCRDSDLESHYEVYAIYVTADQQHKGVGKSLAQFFLTAIYSPCSLWVLTENDQAIAFYKSLDFKADEATKTLTIEGENIEESRYIRL